MLPELSAKQIKALEQFRDLQIGFLKLRLTLWPRITFRKRNGRVGSVRSQVALASVQVNIAHIERAKAELSPQAVQFWASVLLMVDMYDWDDEDDSVTEELNRLAWDGVI